MRDYAGDLAKEKDATKKQKNIMWGESGLNR